jgi:hypothetical protein
MAKRNKNSAWRRAVKEKMPRLRELLEDSPTFGVFWSELWFKFVRAHSDPIDEELIGQVYDYAWWGANLPDPHMHTVAVYSFYEDLPTDPKVREQVAKWLSAQVFTGMGEIFAYHLRSYEDYKEFVREFYDQRDRLGDAAKEDEWRLTDEEFAARVSQSVTRFQEWKQKHGRLQFEFMARVCVVDNEDVMEHLAPALEQTNGDAQAIAAAITPKLLALVSSGGASIAADPLLFAAAALLLAERLTQPLWIVAGPPASMPINTAQF